jgi:hypothetical protein
MQYPFVAVFFILGILVTRLFAPREHATRFLWLYVAAFAVRLFVHVVFLRSELLEYGGDNWNYEGLAYRIASDWRLTGIRFMTESDIPSLHGVAVPCNMFALLAFATNGEPIPVAATAMIAVIAFILCLVIYKFSMLMGADDKSALRLFVITALGPSFVIHTSDMYKDGLNALLVVGALYIAVDVAKRFSPSKLVLLGPVLWMLWHVRPYMVLMCALPIVLGLIGLKRVLSVRGALVTMIALLVALVVLESGGERGAVDYAQETFDSATSQTVREANAEGNSGVTFDDGGKAWGALAPKLAYTLFSPFPWSSGTLVFQLGKLETFLWYYLLYSAVRGLGFLWKNSREELLLLAMFLVPATLAYATSMSNVGLIFRQRMPIVIVTSILSSVVWTHLPGGARANPALPPRRATA